MEISTKKKIHLEIDKFKTKIMSEIEVGHHNIKIKSSWEDLRNKMKNPFRSFMPNARRKIKKRVILKNGKYNIFHTHMGKRNFRYVRDIYNTFVEADCHWTILVFACGIISCWLIFALIWWLIAFTHGDLEPDHLPLQQSESGWNPCVLNILGWASAFLYSLETQHTTGYGVRTITEQCPEAIFILVLQCNVGMIIEAFFGGILLTKLILPKLRTRTIIFSKNAVVSLRDGKLTLMFVVGDLQKKHLIGASIRAQLIRIKKTPEGEILNYYITELTISADECEVNLVLMWPNTVAHTIDESSPFYEMSARDLLEEKFEIIICLEGTVESTGQSIQARTSYLASEILWGAKFEPILSYDIDREKYQVKYSKFNKILPVDTPLCSAAKLDEFYKKQKEIMLDFVSKSNNAKKPPPVPSVDSEKDLEFLREMAPRRPVPKPRQKITTTAQSHATQYYDQAISEEENEDYDNETQPFPVDFV